MSRAIPLRRPSPSPDRDEENPERPHTHSAGREPGTKGGTGKRGREGTTEGPKAQRRRYMALSSSSSTEDNEPLSRRKSRMAREAKDAVSEELRGPKTEAVEGLGGLGNTADEELRGSIPIGGGRSAVPEPAIGGEVVCRRAECRGSIRQFGAVGCKCLALSVMLLIRFFVLSILE